MRFKAVESFAGPYGTFEAGRVYDDNRPVVKDWLRAGFIVVVDGTGSVPEPQQPVKRRRRKPVKP